MTKNKQVQKLARLIEGASGVDQPAYLKRSPFSLPDQERAGLIEWRGGPRDGGWHLTAAGRDTIKMERLDGHL